MTRQTSYNMGSKTNFSTETLAVSSKEDAKTYDPYLKSPLGCYGAASGEAAGLDSDDCSPSSHGSHHDDAHGMDERLFPEDDSNYQPPNPALNKRGEPRQRAEKKYRKDFPDEETFLQYKKEQDKKRQQRKREKDKIKRQTSNSLFPPS
ncbi:uncharacterized protein LOC108672625 [Hyalella azteca]|uniref:Uncharacterized protein LOC108672625 n=1 Tax=Hyalella azteca TaxID=294128 RepID=A0A8B7NQ48_HYAAZ|nr:uncharacterized protein LOC108672625 [Hyalella azteca]